MDATGDGLDEVVEGAERSRTGWATLAGGVLLGLLLGATGVAVASDDDGGSAAPTASATAVDGPHDGEPANDKARRDDRRDDNGRRDDRRGDDKAGKRGLGRHPGKHLLRGGPHRAALHGEFVVAAGDGKFQTLAVQRGTVTAVSATSITLRSDDGFTRAYAVTSETTVKARSGGISSISEGSNANVVALKQGSRLTAQLIHDRPGGRGNGRK